MIRDTAFVLAPHASRFHSLMAASPPHWILDGLIAALIVFLLWTVTTVNPRRSR